MKAHTAQMQMEAQSMDIARGSRHNYIDGTLSYLKNGSGRMLGKSVAPGLVAVAEVVVGAVEGVVEVDKDIPVAVDLIPLAFAPFAEGVVTVAWSCVYSRDLGERGSRTVAVSLIERGQGPMLVDDSNADYVLIAGRIERTCAVVNSQGTACGMCP